MVHRNVHLFQSFVIILGLNVHFLLVILGGPSYCSCQRDFDQSFNCSAIFGSRRSPMRGLKEKWQALFSRESPCCTRSGASYGPEKDRRFETRFCTANSQAMVAAADVQRRSRQGLSDGYTNTSYPNR